MARRVRTAVGHMVGMEENIMVVLLLLLFVLFTASVDDDRVLL